MSTLRLNGRYSDTEKVLTETIAEKLRDYLPAQSKIKPNWKLIYSLSQHGISLTTLFGKARQSKGPCILAIKDADDNVFGAYLNESLKTSERCYGSGQCFLWKLDAKSDKPDVTVFGWTGKNDYMILCETGETGFISVGGGDGKFGLWIKEDLETGYSEKCPTFNNEPLSPDPKFSCSGLEIWGFEM